MPTSAELQEQIDKQEDEHRAAQNKLREELKAALEVERKEFKTRLQELNTIAESVNENYYGLGSPFEDGCEELLLQLLKHVTGEDKLIKRRKEVSAVKGFWEDLTSKMKEEGVTSKGKGKGKLDLQEMLFGPDAKEVFDEKEWSEKKGDRESDGVRAQSIYWLSQKEKK